MSPTLPRISIVTPSFQQGAFIEQTILSILDQGYPNLEYLVIDGGSTDATIDILKRYEGRLTWVSERDRGQSDAINKGLRLATGDVVGYVNSDDLLLPGSLQAVGDYFMSHPSTEWVTGYCRNIDAQNRPIQSSVTAYKNFLLRHYQPGLFIGINFISQMSTFWRRRAMERIGYFNEDQHLVMDYDYWLRLAKIGRPGILRQELSAFRLHADSKSTKRMIQQFQQSAAVAVQSTRNPFLKAFSYVHHYAVIVAYRIFGLR